MSKIDSITKKRLIVYGSLVALLLLYLFILIKMHIFSFTVLWGLLVVLPIIVAADICFVTLPFTVITVFGLSIYTLVKKDYQKFNWLYELLVMMIVLGFFNYSLETLLNNNYYVMGVSLIKVYLNILAAVCCTLSIMFLSRIKDTRVYIATYVLAVLFHIFYLVADVVE